jgi:hypothetical protein
MITALTTGVVPEPGQVAEFAFSKYQVAEFAFSKYQDCARRAQWAVTSAGLRPWEAPADARRPTPLVAAD